MPYQVTEAVYTIIIGNLFTRADIPYRYYLTFSIRGIYVDIRFTRVIDVTFGQLHPYHLSATKKITMMLFTDRYRLLLSHTMRVVDSKDDLSGQKSLFGKDSQTVDL